MNSEKYVGLDVHQAADIGEHAGKALLLWSVTSRLFRHWLNGDPPFYRISEFVTGGVFTEARSNFEKEIRLPRLPTIMRPANCR